MHEVPPGWHAYGMHKAPPGWHAHGMQTRYACLHADENFLARISIGNHKVIFEIFENHSRNFRK